MKRQDPAACLIRLTSLLAEETSRLGRGDFRSTVELLKEKQSLVSAIRDLAADRSLPRNPDAAARLQDLRREIDVNKGAIEQAIRVQRILLGIIADATRRSTRSQSYGPSGIAVMPRSGALLGGCRA